MNPTIFKQNIIPIQVSMTLQSCVICIILQKDISISILISYLVPDSINKKISRVFAPHFKYPYTLITKSSESRQIRKYNYVSPQPLCQVSAVYPLVSVITRVTMYFVVLIPISLSFFTVSNYLCQPILTRQYIGGWPTINNLDVCCIQRIIILLF